MKIVFILGDGSAIEMPSEHMHLTCISSFNPSMLDPSMDASVEWLEDLWKLEDKR